MLNYLRRGRGEPLVLIHPLGAELVVWEPVLERVARERDVIALDLPGFGASAPVRNGTLPTPQVLAGSVAAFLDELGLGRVHVAGNSLGGWVAPLELAKSGRALSVAGLCTAGFWKRPLGPRPGADMAPFGPRPHAGHAHPAAQRARAALGTERLDRKARPGAAGGGRAARARLRHLAGLRARQRGDALGRVLRFEQIRAPVTLAWGEHDRLVARPRTTVPGWRSVTLHGCGHIPTWDNPSQVARVLLLASA